MINLPRIGVTASQCAQEGGCPLARLDKHWAPSLGALLGFALGVLGHMLAVA